MNVKEKVIKDKFLTHYSEIFEADLIEEMFAEGEYRTIPRGELLIDIGDVLTHIPLLIKGLVKIIRIEKGDEFTLHYLEAGETCAISFANCIHGRKSVFRGIVESDLEAIFIPIKLIDNWLSRYKSFRFFIIDSYHFRLMEMVKSIDSLAFMKMKSRIWKYLTDKVKVSDTENLIITHQQIAQDLNTKREVITRIINKLHKERIIFSTRNRVKVLVPLE